MTAGFFDLFRRAADEPVEHGPFVAPTFFGRRKRAFRRNVPADIRVIAANAGELTVEQLAEAMAISVSRVKALAASQRPPIDLTLKKEPEPMGA